MSIFINIPGIVGSGGDSLHQGWIVIDSAALNIIKDVSYESHSTAAPTIEKPTNSVVSITKRMCSASAQLKQLSTEKNPFNWEMDLTQSAQGLVSAFNSVYAHYEFEKSYITELACRNLRVASYFSDQSFLQILPSI